MHFIYAHLIGDYILQTHWMAANKKSSIFACMVHVLTYMVPFFFTSLSWWQLLLIAMQHWAQDGSDFVVSFMKAKGSGKFAEPPFGPWSVILIDNILHILFMAPIASL